MKKNLRRLLPMLVLAALVATVLSVTALAADPTEEPGTKMIECPVCGTSGACMDCYGLDEACESCGGTNVCSNCGGAGYVTSPSRFYNTAWALLPPVIAIALALITKEVYSSLFLGIVVGGLLYSNFGFEGTVLHVFEDGIISVLSDSYNVGILVFLVILGAMVCLMNKAGGSAAFGRWAQTHIKSRAGAQLATIVLGCLIFIDDYFNCLTVGSVMRPITDKHRISRAKLAYLIDATAAPICIIAPISSWAAAVAGFAEDGQGLNLFVRAIPFNFYAILTVVMMVGMVLMKVEFGTMAIFERNAEETGDLFSGPNPYAMMDEEVAEDKGRVLDLVLPIVVLVICCVTGMIYSGGFFSGTGFVEAFSKDEEVAEDKGRVLDLVLPIVVLVICCVTGMIYSGGFFSGTGFVEAFSNSDASVGLMLGSAFALVFTVVYYMIRRSMTFRQMMECIPEGFKAMVPAIMILTFAWSLKAMTDSLGAKYFVRDFVQGNAASFQMFLPAIVFVIGCLLAFATGTSWGTFGMLIPIVQNVFSMDDPLAIVCISACMAGAVCGDHCSPISDTTIMASAGAQCDHVSHVSTQLPYAVVAAAVSFVSYIVAGMVPNAFIALPVSIVLMLCTLVVIRVLHGKNNI